MNRNAFLNKLIYEGYSIPKLAKEMEMPKCTMYRKINGDSKFDSDEIGKAIKILHIADNEIVPIFFAV
jgi:predicted transcriptional regulator